LHSLGIELAEHLASKIFIEVADALKRVPVLTGLLVAAVIMIQHQHVDDVDVLDVPGLATRGAFLTHVLCDRLLLLLEAAGRLTKCKNYIAFQLHKSSQFYSEWRAILNRAANASCAVSERRRPPWCDRGVGRWGHLL
jgi:hypothetical protein